MTFVPRDYQDLIMDHQQRIPREATWSFMGSGKTVSTLTAHIDIDAVTPGPLLVVGPLRVIQSTWPDEVRKWPHLARHWETSVITGTPKEREAALARDANLFTVNYEQLEWLVDYHVTGKRRWPFRKIVVDEATRLKSFRTRQGGKRAAALNRVAAVASHFNELTGTPAPQGIADLWGQMYFLDRGERLGRSFSAFTSRWFYPHPSGFGVVPKDSAQFEIQELLRDICITIDGKDFLDLEQPVVNVIPVELPAKAMAQYKEMEKKMFLELEGVEIEAVSAAARTIKCLQLSAGSAYLDEACTKWAEVHDAKLQALESVIAEASTPVLVAYHFKSDLERLLKAFPRGRVLDKNPKTIRDWNAGKIPVLFAHPQSAGHGLNLQDGGNVLCFYGLWWALEEHQQIIERIGPARQKQSGHDRPVYVHYLIARGTVDELVLKRLQTKASVQEVLLNAMKERKK